MIALQINSYQSFSELGHLDLILRMRFTGSTFLEYIYYNQCFMYIFFFSLMLIFMKFVLFKKKLSLTCFRVQGHVKSFRRFGFPILIHITFFT